MSESAVYEVYVVRYATRAERTRGDNFIATDAHDVAMPIDFYVWVIRNDQRTIVVDTGFDHEEAARRDRQITRLPREGLSMLGIDSGTVEDVIISHLHYDHAGTLDHFPRAKFHIQDLEVGYATGRHMCESTFRDVYSVHHVTSLVEHLYAGRVVFHDGDEVIAPGVVVHHIGGHTMGMQCVSVATKRGTVVLAVDAAHFYENMEKPSPFPLVYSVADMLRGFHTMRNMATSPKHVIPGHDPLVMQRYPAPCGELEGVVARLDVAPRE